MTRPKVLLTAPFDNAEIARLMQMAEVEQREQSMTGLSLSEAGVTEILSTVEVIVAELDAVDAATLDRAPNLKIVVSCRAKPANVDIDACSARGIPVVTTPGRNAEVTADLSFALILATVRKTSQAERWMRAGMWSSEKAFEPYERFRSFQMKDRILSVLGGGAVGRRVIQRANGFGMKVKVYDPYLPAHAFGAQAEIVSLDEAMSTGDVITVHIPFTSETEGVIGAHELSLMKPSAFLVNAGRAGIIDEEALMAVLRENRIAGAGFDVFYEEPLSVNSELFSLENVTLTPHIAGASDDVIGEHSRMAVDAIDAYIEGRELPAVHNRAQLS